MTRQLRLGRRVAVAGFTGLLAGCGFHPVYGSRGVSGGSQRELAAIDVALLPDRTGQLLRQALQQRFDRGEAVAKQYTLSVSYGIAGEGISVEQDSSVTRIRLVGQATWFLKALDPAQTLVTSGSARSLDGVNVLDQQYFEQDLATETAQRRLAENVADQITLQIATFFSRRAAMAAKKT